MTESRKSNFCSVSYKLLGQMYHSITSLDLGMDQEVLLNPGKYSKDMDVDGGVSFPLITKQIQV